MFSGTVLGKDEHQGFWTPKGGLAMFESFSGKAIMAKAKAMYGRRLTPDDYSQMLRKRTVADLAAYLKNETGYGECLKSIQETAIHRGQLENVLRRDLFQRYLRLIRYDSSRGFGFYSYAIMRMEIEQILECIQHLNAGNSEDMITSIPGFLNHYASFDLMKLAQVRTFPQLIDTLKGTSYQQVLIPFLRHDGKPIDFTASEVALRRHYYNRIDALIDKQFKGKRRDELKVIFDTKAELLNISTIYRLKVYYHADRKTVEEHLMPQRERIGKKTMNQLLEAKDSHEILTALSSSGYAKYVQGDFLFIEYTSQQIRYYLNKRFIRFSICAPTVLAAYMVLSEIELENIISIIEGVRYGISPENIQQLLVFTES